MSDFADPSVAPYPITQADRDAIRAAIDPDELAALALAIGNIPSPPGGEAQVSAFVFDWLKGEGFKPRRVGAVADRQNVIGEYGGEGIGPNLLMTAHLDTQSPTNVPEHDAIKYTSETLADPEWLKCWIDAEGGFRGYPLINDRGPMSCMLIAGKALKKAGIRLGGLFYMTACPGEIGPEPVDEFAGLPFLGKDIGANYLFHHGGVAPDYAIAAEATDFGATWQGCGYAVFRIRLYGDMVFTPLIEHPADPAYHPNPIYRLGAVIAALHGWALQYEADSIYEGPGGVSKPKVQIAAVRGGVPYDFGAGTEVCVLYLEVGLGPRQGASQAYHGVKAALRQLDLKAFDLDAPIVRNGFEANAFAVAPLAGAADAATRQTLGAPLQRASPTYSSMWRDHNVFNMNRIPAITTGMPYWRPTVEDLTNSALIYALTVLGVCGRAD